MNKRGESLTSAQLIMIVLAILGFLILLALFSQFGGDNYSQDEICKLSVLSRATASEVKAGTQSLVPLQCTTSKICIVESSKGECKQFVGEKDISKLILPKVKAGEVAGEEEQAREIEKQMAQSMLNCWNMMGQGKLDLFGTLAQGYGFEQAKSKCVICSRVAIGNDVSESVLSKVDVNRYMEKTTVPGTTLTYTQAMSDGATSSYSTFKEDGEDSLETVDSVKIEDFSTNEFAFVFMQVKSIDATEVWKNQLTAAGVVTGSAFVASPSSVVGTLKLARYIFTPTGLAVTTVAVVGVGGVGAYNAWKGQAVATGYCGDFVSNSEKASKGCSLLQSFPYSVSNVKNLCGSLEGNA